MRFWYTLVRLSRQLAALGVSMAPWQLAALRVEDFDRLRALVTTPPPPIEDRRVRG